MQNLDLILKQHKLNFDEYKQIKNILQREPNITEIGIFSALWSEHCSYKTSKKYLKTLPTKAPFVLQGPGENAGVIDIGDGYAAVFKIESHNHPSFIEPYQGAATGVGGILRDIFTMGARPIANINSLRFGDALSNNDISKKQKYLIKGAIRGIGDYGNCMGVPTIGGDISFDECYKGNILVNAFSLGIVKKENIFYAKASGVGNSIIYVGSATGKDGLGGAVMSSDSFHKDLESSKSLRPTVQVGDPFAQKILLEACLELFQKDYIVGLQDMGAAGLTSSSFEMAYSSNSGMKIYIDKIPARENNMSPYDFMLSESQERMLICAKKGCEDKIKAIFDKWDIHCSIIGEIIQEQKIELIFQDKICANIPVKPIIEQAPTMERKAIKPPYLDELSKKNISSFAKKSTKKAFDILSTSLEIVSKKWIYEQYDYTIQTNTIVPPGSLDSSAIRIKENGCAIVFSSGVNQRKCFLNPKEGIKLNIAHKGRDCALRGAKPMAITNCLNFGSPENQEVMWQFEQSIKGMKEACETLGTPVVSGNVSLYNKSEDIDIYPTPTIVMVGLKKSQDNITKSSFNALDNALYIIGANIKGDFENNFGGSLYLKEVHNQVCAEINPIDLDFELRLWDFLLDDRFTSIVQSAKNIGSGGLAMALYKSASISGIGCVIKINFKDDLYIYDESPSRAIIEVKQKDKNILENICAKYNIDCANIGYTHNDFQINNIKYSIDDLQKRYFNTFEHTLFQGT